MHTFLVYKINYVIVFLMTKHSKLSVKRIGRESKCQIQMYFMTSFQSS